MAWAAGSARAYWRLLRANPNYRRLWLAQVVSELGDWLYAVVIYTFLLERTGSAKAVAVAFVLQVLPQVFVAPMAGIVNDRASRRRVMIAADLARAVIVLSMLVASRIQSIPLIYALLFLETVMWAFFEPGRSAVVPNITATGELVTANALSSMTWSFNLALGAGLGGVIAVYVGRDAVFLLDSLSFVASALLISRMRFEERHLAHGRPLRPRDLVDFSPVAEGVKYVAGDRRLLSLLLVKAGLGLLAVQWVLLPVFGQRIFPVTAPHLDPARGALLAMSALLASRGVGSLLGPYFGGFWAGQSGRRLRLGILFGYVFAGLGYLGLGAAPSLALASLAMMLTNAGTSIGWVFSTTLLQQHTDDRFRGRVFSADFAFLAVSMSLAAFVAGLLIDGGVSARAVAFGAGLLALAPAALWILAMRRWGQPAS